MPSNRARTRLGVGESTRLTFSLGAATWTQSPAADAGSLSGSSGTAVTYTAPDRQNTVIITAVGGGCTATITLTIVEPSDIRMVRKPGTLGNHTRGTTSVGFIAEIYFLPADVSFEHCSYLEDEVDAIGTGCLQQYMSTHHVGHHPNTTPITVGPPVSDTTGSKVNGFDRIAASTSKCDGGFTLPIPWRFQVGSGASKIFKIVDQVAVITAAGGADISKAGASNHSDFNDATEKDPLF